MSILTKAILKNEMYLGITALDFDDALNDLIEEVEAEVEQYIGIKLSAVTDEEEDYDGGKDTYWLKRKNISNVQAWSDQDRDFEDTDEIDTDDFVVYAEEGKVVFDSVLAQGNLTVRIEYDGGWTITTIPKDLKRALAVEMTYRFRRRKDIGLASVTYPDGTIDKMEVTEFLSANKKVFDRYKRMFL